MLIDDSVKVGEFRSINRCLAIAYSALGLRRNITDSNIHTWRSSTY